MRKYLLFISVLASLVLFYACAKEYSIEGRTPPSEGALEKSDSGDCLPMVVNGVYEAGTALGADNYLEVQVHVTKAGSYSVFTDSLNGFHFRAEGSFADTGLVTVRLQGEGTPLVGGTHRFRVTYNDSQCFLGVTTLQAGTAGTAAFTLNGAPNACSLADVQGAYIQNTALVASNKVVLSVNVTRTGTYDVTTTISNGMTFSGSGTLSALGPATITLTGSGTPTAAGTTNVPIHAGGSFCSFAVPVTESSLFTIDCGTAVVSGRYEVGRDLGATNTVTLNVNVTNPGGYDISATANGMTFAATGTFTAPGPTTITLVGSGLPVNAEATSVRLDAGTAPCSFIVTVNPRVIAWTFMSGGNLFQGSLNDAAETTVDGARVLHVEGWQDDGIGKLALFLSNTTGPITTGTYSGTSTTGMNATFVYTLPGDAWVGAPTTGSNLTAELVVYNPATHIVQGTFSGTVKKQNGTVVTITDGTFDAYYP